jgi:hypothetical protein
MSSSSSDDRSHEGGVRLCPPPRRQASAVTVRQPSATVEAAPPAPVKSSSHKPPQAMQAKAPDSPTPLPKSQRSAAKTTAQPNPYYYPASMIRHGYPAMMAPIAPSYGIPSETSASTGYFPVRHPSTAYGTYISPQGGHHMVLASSSSAPTSSIDSITTGFSGMKLALQYQDVCRVPPHSPLRPPYRTATNCHLGGEQIHTPRTGADLRADPDNLSAEQCAFAV